MGMNAYLDNTPSDKRTLIDIENIFDGYCKYPVMQHCEWSLDMSGCSSSTV